MNRRKALRAMTALGVIAITPAISGCKDKTLLALQPWSGPPVDEKDVRLLALSYAILAPNAHNTQPWRIGFPADNVIDLYVDDTRLLPETDPAFRQTHVSQGTFLELLVLALGELGYRADVEYFPAGEYSNTVVESRAVARVRIGAGGGTRDPLFAHIIHRRSNKRPYQVDKPVSDDILRMVLQRAEDPRAGGSPTKARITTDPAARASFANLGVAAMSIEVEDRQRNVETAKWFRFSDAEIASHRDGFGLVHNGRTGLRRWVAETFVVSRERAADPQGAFARGAIDLAREQLESTPAFGIITTATNTRRAQLLAGRAYVRVALAAESLGLAMHPMSQLLEEYPAMQSAKARFENEIELERGHTAQMFFRLGFAEPAPHTPRRNLKEMMRA